MYRGESFGLTEYWIATLPLYLTFFLVMYVGTRVFNEEYLMGFKPLHKKITEALYLSLNQRHLSISIFSLSLLLIPIVFAVQLVSFVFVSNLPSVMILCLVMLMSVVIEEVAKSIGLFVLLQNGIITTTKRLFKLAFLSALGFWVGEKLLLLLTLKITSESDLISTFLGTSLFNGWLLFVPLILHTVSTFVVGLVARRKRKISYLTAILAGSVIHAIYNFAILLASGAVH
jgi:hypothetical protein